MKEEWEIKKLEDLALVINGGTPDTNIPDYWDGGVLWLTPKDMGLLTSKYVSATSRTISEKGLEKSSAKLIPNNSLILSTRAPIGYLAINTCTISTNQGCKGIVPNEKLSVEYLYYYFSKSVKKLIDLGKGTTFKELSTSSLKNVEIPLPPLSEQKKIVALLDDVLSRIDKARENIEKNIENAEELLQTSLDLIHCPKEELGKIVNICTGKLNANQAVEDGQYPFFTCSRTASKIDRYTYDCEAILLAGNNASGDFNVKHYKGKFEAYQRTYILTAKDEKNIDYRFLYFQVMRSLETLKKEAVGTNTKFLRLPMIQSLKIAYPNISEQREYVKKIDALLLSINKLTQSYKQKLIDLDELRNSVLEKAFRGELT